MNHAKDAHALISPNACDVARYQHDSRGIRGVFVSKSPCRGRGLPAFVVSVLVSMALMAVTAERSLSQGEPPYDGTIFIDPDIITASDPTAFQEVTDAGRGDRTVFDRRVDDWITVNAYLFNATFDDGLTAEIQVNPEFGSSAAAIAEAGKYGRLLGQLPAALRSQIELVWIHKGDEPLGGGTYPKGHILIHTGDAELLESDGVLEEALAHEGAHASLDATHADSQGWLDAQTADGGFISTYARDNPEREDVAESFVPYLAVRFRSGRISLSDEQAILNTIPNRIAYFDALSLDMHPVVAEDDMSDSDDAMTEDNGMADDDMVDEGMADQSGMTGDIGGGGGGGGCALSPGAGFDPVLIVLLGLAAIHLSCRRRHLGNGPSTRASRIVK